MKKLLILSKKENDYQLTLEGDRKKSIKIIDKVISGEELYTSFYEGLKEKIEYEITTELTNSEDKIIYNQISDLFKKIDKEVNNYFNNDTGE